MGPPNAFLRNPLLFNTETVSSRRVSETRLKIETNDAKTFLLSRLNVSTSIHLLRVRVVYDERLLRLDARFYQAVLTVACFEHVQVDTDMRVEETLLEEARFPRGLRSDKNYTFQWSNPVFAILLV